MERTAQVPLRGRRPLRLPKRVLAVRSDAALVDLARAGDEAAFEVLYDRYAAGVLGFCRHMLGSQDEAEDALQQAFLSAHSAMADGTREISFKPWIYTIARNRCISMLRARREQPAELPEISTAGLAAEVEQRAELRELVADVQRLPEDQRAALLLAELGGLSHAEVAQVIGHRAETIKGLVFRARSALAERREARAAACADIRVELAAATGGGLRRGRLRYHLEICPACSAYLQEVRRQRRLLAVALPVVPAAGLKESVLAGVGIGGTGAAAAGSAAGGAAVSGGGAAVAGGGAGAAAGGAGVAGGLAAAGGTVASLVGGTAAKVAIVGALALGGAGVATEAVLERDGGTPPTPPAGERPVGSAAEDAPGRAGSASTPATPPHARGDRRAARASERRAGRRGAERRERGQAIARERSGGRSAAGDPPGLARRGPASAPRAAGPGRDRRAGPPAEPGPRLDRKPATPPPARAVPRREGGSVGSRPRPAAPALPAPPPTAGPKGAPPSGPELAPPAAGGAAPTAPGTAAEPDVG